MENCIFCKIIKGEIPAYMVYQDEHISAFLDISQKTYGHTLVIPNKHYENIFDVPEVELCHVIKGVKMLSQKIKKNLGADGVNIINCSGKEAHQSVFHLHFHILPRFKNDGLTCF